MTIRKIKRSESSPDKVMTIPKLRQSFEYIEKFAGGTTSVDALRREWKKTFGGKAISEDQARAYLTHIASNKKQGGGAVPGLYSSATVPGQDVPGGYAPYGRFMEYLTSGFDVGVPRMSSGDLCGKVDISPKLLPDMGSNAATTMKGGKRKMRKTRKQGKQGKKHMRKSRKFRGGTRLPMATNPTSAWQDAFTYLRGQPLGNSPSPVDAAPVRLYNSPSLYDSYKEINAITPNYTFNTATSG